MRSSSVVVEPVDERQDNRNRSRVTSSPATFGHSFRIHTRRTACTSAQATLGTAMTLAPAVGRFYARRRVAEGAVVAHLRWHGAPLLTLALMVGAFYAPFLLSGTAQDPLKMTD